ncbi:hypothetical protein BKA63DRAFT_573453 [Paraphoma chrysanthemicola]|nr:hypothetical protein BKA63DRAFT_573453 [Paraphoma chrysanthemicola]
MSADEHAFHFFLLPRELRDSIYGYLSHNIEFQWRWNYWPFFGRDGIATVRIENVPCLNALLTSTQLGREYSASMASRATPTALDVILGRGDACSQENDRFCGLIEQLLPRIDCLNIMIYIRSPKNDISHHFWFQVYSLIRVLRNWSPQMKSLQITAFIRPPVHPEARVGQANDLAPRAFFPPPHNLLNGFSLARHARHYCLVSEDNYHDALNHLNRRLEANATSSPAWIQMGKWVYTSTHDQGSRGA